MSEISHITNWSTVLLELLPAQHRAGTTWISLLSAMTGESQNQEDALYSLWQARADLDQATDDRLDGWGRLVGVQREDLSDDDYRRLIRARLQVLRSEGSPDELIRIVDAMTDSGGNTLYWETPPACFSIQYDGNTWTGDHIAGNRVATYIKDARPAGVAIGQVIERDPTSGFTFGTDGSRGFSEEGGTTNGLFCVDIAAEIGE